ncbi:GGDEF domain-containing protein [Aliikangiella sp. IMCC44653]
MLTFLKWLALASLSLAAALLQANSTEFQRQLEAAESIKSSNAAEFAQLIGQLEAHFDQFDINQKYYYLYLKGYLHALGGKVDDAEKNYLHVFNNSHNVSLKYRTAFSLVNLFAFKREWKKGLDFIQFIEANRNAIYDLGIKHQGLIAAAIFYDQIEYHAVTIRYLSQVLSEGTNQRNLCLAKGMSLKSKRLLGEELNYALELSNAIEICEKAKEHLLANVIRSDLASYYVKEQRTEDALNLLTSIKEPVEKSQYQFLILEVYSLLARAYWLSNNFDKANEMAQTTVNLGKNVEQTKRIAESYHVLYQVALKAGELKRAIEYLKAYFDAEKKHFQEINGRQLAIESAKRQSAEKDAKISSLNKVNHILQLEKDLAQESATYNRWIIILLLFSLTVLTLWVVHVKRSQQKLKYLAEYDSLTQISNRAYFTQSAETMLSYYARFERKASIILFDLDKFKKINDNHGHPVGDKVLKLTALACKECVRKVDIFGRVGGEEFAILLPGCEPEQALRIAEECRLKISEIDVTPLGLDDPITASFGVADSQSSGYLLKDLIAHADEAMYLAKRRGRNQVVSYKPI